MTAINLPSLSFNIVESSDKETLNNILDTLQLYRKELNFLLMNLDGDNMPSILGRIEDGEGNISNISQTVDEISMTVANSAGDISNLQITANQISAKVANAQGDIAALELTAKGLTSTVASHTGQISQIKQTATSIQTQVSNNKGEISTVKQTAQGIQSQVSNLDGEVGGFYSSITQLSEEISSKVGYRDYNGREIASLINQEAHRITISAEAIDLTGVTTLHSGRYPNSDYLTFYGNGLALYENRIRRLSIYHDEIRTNISGGAINFPDTVYFNRNVHFDGDVYFYGKVDFSKARVVGS